ncbi:MAG: putative nucleotidyltransferase [Saprospiraceae bacterium]
MTGKIVVPESYIECFQCVELAAKEAGTKYMLVGATARDWLFQSAGIASERLTTDIDISLCADSWESFEKFKILLLNSNFETNPANQHRFTYTTQGYGKVFLDIVPYRGINDPNDEISWPPDGTAKMNVLGFQEAGESGLELSTQTGLSIPVVSVPGLCLLKLIAWLDRPRDIRTKDAQDIKFILGNYESLDGVREAAFDEGFVERYSFDLDLACAAKLGMEVRKISADSTFDFIVSKLFAQKDEPDTEQLAMEMSNREELQAQQSHETLLAFRDGFLG